MVSDVDKPSTTIFSREIQSSYVTSAMHSMILLHCNIFRVSLSIIFNHMMVQSSTGNPYDSAGMAYELIASKVCLLESSDLSADLVVLSIWYLYLYLVLVFVSLV